MDEHKVEMYEVLIHLALWTYLVQAVLFAVPVLASIYFCLYGISAAIKTLFFESYEDIEKYHLEKKAKEKALKDAREAASKSPGKERQEMPVLRPLNCSACGARVPMNAEQIFCPFCHSPVAVPGDYRHIGRIREEAARKLKNATRYWRRARFFTSPSLKWLARIIAVWLFAIPVILAIADSNEHLGSYGEFMTENIGLSAVALCTLLFWILILTVFSYSFEPRIRRVLPKLEFGENIGKPENAGCAQCGAPIRYEAHDLAAICGYCGVETWRAKLAWEWHTMANNARQKANFSLVDAKEEFSDAIWNAAFVPLFLISIFLIVPLFIGGAYLFLDYLAEYRIYLAIAASVVLLTMLAIANRNDLRRLLAKYRGSL